MLMTQVFYAIEYSTIRILLVLLLLIAAYRVLDNEIHISRLLSNIMRAKQQRRRSDRMPRMAKDFLESPLWERFEEAARKRRRDPVRLLKEFMKERLEVWEDQKLDREVKKAALRSGRREEDAVEIVRRRRLDRSRPSATS